MAESFPLRSLEYYSEGHLTTFPRPLTRLLGRDDDLAQLVDMLRRPDVRLLTLTGAGGSGKTRLALEAVVRAIEEFPDGGVFVDVAPLRDPELVLPELARVLRLPEGHDQDLESQLITYLAPRMMLVVLDNVEQVVAFAPALTRLLADAPLIKILVTSRIALRLSGEFVFMTQPLPLPPATASVSLTQALQAPAVQLFVERAQAVKTDLVFEDQDMPTVIDICRKLDGLPLAIELAAARVRLLSLDELCARLPQDMSVLSNGVHDAPERQHTLWNTLDWSYHLLSQREQQCFTYLAVFAGSFTLQAAEALLNDVVQATREEDESTEATHDTDVTVSGLEVLDQLLHKNMITAVVDATGEQRLVLLETVREYAHAKLLATGAADRVHQRHASWYASLAEQAAPALHSHETASWLTILEREQHQWRTALAWSLKHDVPLALRLCTALGRFWEMQGYLNEGRRWFTLVLEQDSLQLAAAGVDLSQAAQAQQHQTRFVARVRALNGQGRLAYIQGAPAQAQQAHREALDLLIPFDDLQLLAETMRLLGNTMLAQNDYGAAKEYYTAALAYCPPTQEDGRLRADILNNLGVLASRVGDHEESHAYLTECLALQRAIGNEQGIGFALGLIGDLYYYAAKYEQAQAYYTEALEILRSLHKVFFNAVLSSLGMVLVRLGELEQARNLLLEALHLQQELQDPEGLIDSLENVAEWCAVAGQGTLAARILGATAVARQTLQMTRFIVEADQHEQLLQRLRAELGAEGLQAALERGQALSLDQAVALFEAEPLPSVAHLPEVQLDEGELHPAPTAGLVAGVALTDRQREVLRLMAQGLTNPQIAERLVVSRRTVDTHVRAIFSKLGITSRSAATRLAVQHGLL